MVGPVPTNRARRVVRVAGTLHTHPQARKVIGQSKYNMNLSIQWSLLEAMQLLRIDANHISQLSHKQFKLIQTMLNLD